MLYVGGKGPILKGCIAFKELGMHDLHIKKKDESMCVLLALLLLLTGHLDPFLR